LRNQLQSAKQNLQKVLDDACHEKQRADQYRMKSKDLKHKLATALSAQSELKEINQSQVEMLSASQKFIHDVLQVLQTQTCQEAVTQLQEMWKKADFYRKTCKLLG
jgi:DNA-binding LytR/AlgR family response regulator